MLLDYFLWEYLKNVVYCEPPTTPEDIVTNRDNCPSFPVRPFKESTRDRGLG
ncbi:hypothetical protein WH47_07101 [Habropoda laboriosa]|uniref:Uncharacterized protein n=1 Tax=Habropoda laboriosa TaxID=597456 RepID=A0A0L7QRF1_9HYME|nr:hypothetical protein WH47_07101 [Habropoda laboriosa]